MFFILWGHVYFYDFGHKVDHGGRGDIKLAMAGEETSSWPLRSERHKVDLGGGGGTKSTLAVSTR